MTKNLYKTKLHIFTGPDIFLWAYIIYLLGWFFYSAVCVEGSQLLLDSTQGIGKVSVVQNFDGGPDPLKEVWGQGLIIVDHGIILNTLVDDLEKKQKTISFITPTFK